MTKNSLLCELQMLAGTMASQCWVSIRAKYVQHNCQLWTGKLDGLEKPSPLMELRTQRQLCLYQIMCLNCLYSVPPICLPLCPVLSLHRQPAKPDSRVAYQAFCQPGCLIALSKPPPAFCLPPPRGKKSLPVLARSVLPPCPAVYLPGPFSFPPV